MASAGLLLMAYSERSIRYPYRLHSLRPRNRREGDRDGVSKGPSFETCVCSMPSSAAQHCSNLARQARPWHGRAASSGQYGGRGLVAPPVMRS